MRNFDTQYNKLDYDDEDHCIVCGNLLPKNPRPDSPQAQGYCCFQCMRADENVWISDVEY